jgi:hypothetical protein
MQCNVLEELDKPTLEDDDATLPHNVGITQHRIPQKQNPQKHCCKYKNLPLSLLSSKHHKYSTSVSKYLEC